MSLNPPDLLSDGEVCLEVRESDAWVGFKSGCIYLCVGSQGYQTIITISAGGCESSVFVVPHETRDDARFIKHKDLIACAIAGIDETIKSLSEDLDSMGTLRSEMLEEWGHDER